MSRIGKLPIDLPKGVTVTLAENNITVKGPKGELNRSIMTAVQVTVDDSKILVTRADETIQSRAAHGLVRTLINNMVVGVTNGYQTDLEINGVGYRAEVKRPGNLF